MQSNIPKPIAASKQSNLNQTDYIVGDVVVLVGGEDDTLYAFSRVNTALNAKCYITKHRKEKMLCVWISDIRHATAAEITARRRLNLSTSGVLIA